jgi:RimJ/RimL family protein N-acetyltransferase
MDDDKGMFEMDSDPEVHRYLGKRPLTSLEQSRDAISFIMQQYKDLGIGRWAVIEKATGDFVGWTGHKRFVETVNGHKGHIDFGYRQARRFWGKGYATEAGYASLHYGIDQLGLTDLYAMTDVDNGASRRVLEKLGFRLVEVFAYDAEPNWRDAGAPTTWFEWQGNKKP